MDETKPVGIPGVTIRPLPEVNLGDTRVAISILAQKIAKHVLNVFLVEMDPNARKANGRNGHVGRHDVCRFEEMR
tara:strand:- start:4084 stop:4308 length:225 start_codon:yes stop_codon:yes gene_type:complete